MAYNYQLLNDRDDDHISYRPTDLRYHEKEKDNVLILSWIAFYRSIS